MSVHRIALTVTGLATAVVLTACGGGTDTAAMTGDPASSSASASAHSDADVTFAQQMTVHHQQAVEMAQLAADRAGSPEVADLAARIEAAQGPEIETMTGWLDAWGAEAPMSGTENGMDHGSGHGSDAMAGAMSEEELDRLGGLSGAAFDREFLTLMTRHHEGAVEMARTEQAQGSDPDAVALAGQVVSQQTAEIEEMRTLLAQL